MRTRVLLLFLLLFTVGSAFAQLPEPGKWYHMKNRHSGLYLGIMQNGLYAGCALEQNQQSTEDGQAFRFEQVEDNLYKIEVKNKNMVLGTVKKDWGEHLGLSKWDNRDDQLFELTPAGDGYYNISSAATGAHWNIDRGRKDAGAWILFWPNADLSYQSTEYTFEPFEGENPYPWENLGPNVNSDISEVAPMVSHDGRVLYFSRGHSKNGRIGDGNIFRCELKPDGTITRSRLQKGKLNNDWHNVVCSAMPGDNMLAVFSDYTKGDAMISTTTRTADGWTFPTPINIPRTNRTTNTYTARMGADGRTIVMEMRTKRSKDEHDANLFVSLKDDKGKWSAPIWLGDKINTEYGEITPFLAADMKTLYFSSNRPGGYGASDVYMSKRLDDTWKNWSDPVNLGPEINGPSWELYYVVPADGSYAYFSSSTMSYGASDIHRVRLKEAVKPDPVLLVEGTTLNQKDNSPVAATIRYEALDGSGTLGEVQSDPQTGYYQIALPQGKQYGFFASASGFVSVNDNVNLTQLQATDIVEKDLYLVPIEKGEVIRLNNIFFDFGKATLRSESFPELDRLAQLLKTNSKLSIEIGGHTDNVGQPTANQTLSASRAQAVVDYLVQKGIATTRLTSKGYGETVPVATNETDEGRQLNRRVEFRIL